MNQRDDKHVRQNFNPTNVYTKNPSGKNVDESLVKEKDVAQEPDYTDKIKELLAPYYDEFHFANYE